MKILFDVSHLYYLAHFEPVIDQLLTKQVEIGVILYDEIPSYIKSSCAKKGITCHSITLEQASEFYRKEAASWVVFGHANSLSTELNFISKTALIMHGLGPKSAYYNASSFDIQYRFVESKVRSEKLQEMYPNKTFITTGYTKLDPLINQQVQPFNLEAIGLDPSKKTLLYSPTFYPSTIENFPSDWPEQFANYNILIKPHYFSLVKSAYKKQRKLFEQWKQYPNVYFARSDEQSLLPFMATADLMISETSSALFEFMALNKPVIVCHFLRLRWSYRGIFKFRLNNRLSEDYDIFRSIGTNIDHFSDLAYAVEHNLANPEQYAKIRQSFIEQIVGNVDGQCSKRVADFLISHP